jgi:hypothetical protein
LMLRIWYEHLETGDQVIHLGPSLKILVPVSMPEVVVPQETQGWCGKCEESILSWPALTEGEPLHYVGCRCLLLCFNPDRVEVGQVVSSWKSLRRLKAEALNRGPIPGAN